MKQKPYIYLDENIIQYVHEKKIKLDEIENVEWIFSDEHLIEIERSRNLDILDVLKELRARRIKIKLNDKFQILNEAIIDEYKNPKEIYKEYKDNTAFAEEINMDFAALQVFIFGNKEIIDIEQYVDKYILSIKKLIKPTFEFINNKKYEFSYELMINKLKKDLLNSLKTASKQLKPVEEIRKKIVKLPLSNLDEKNGLIIDQIWEKIIENNNLIFTKDQFFGKEKMPFYNGCDIWSTFLGISQCHSALNYLGYWPDKGLKKISKIHGINSDSSHIGHAAFCAGIISADDRLCKKAKAIYQYFNLPVVVIKVDILKK